MKKIMALICTLIVALSLATNVTTVLAATENYAAERIQELIDLRGTLTLSMTRSNTMAVTEVDTELERLGAEFLNEEQVQELFSRPVDGQVQSRVTVPAIKANKWLSFRTKNINYKGKKYNIQTITATPETHKSHLWDFETLTVAFDYNWVAGVTDMIKSVARNAAGVIPYSAIPLGFYDAVSAFTKGISKTSSTTVPHIAYTYSTATHATFEYARLESESDSMQKLTNIHTKVLGTVQFTIPSLSYKNTAGTWKNITFGDLQSGQSQVYAYPESSITSLPALYGYVNNMVVTSTVQSYTITGPKNKLVKKVYPCAPNFPAQCG